MDEVASLSDTAESRKHAKARALDRSLVRGVPLMRRVTALGAMVLFKLIHPVPGVADYTCGYRMYRVDLLRRGYERWGEALLGEPSFACMPDLLLKLSVFRPSIGEAPLVLRYDRKAGPSKMAVARTIRRTLLLLGRHRLGRCRA